MNIEISIDLPPYLEAFLRGEFACPTGPVVLNRSHGIGLRISSLVCTSQYPQLAHNKKNPVPLVLPQSPYLKAEYKFAYMPREHERQVRDYIKSEFMLRAESYFTVGYRHGFRQRDIANAFLQAYSMANDAITFDAVKKNDYRKRIRVLKRISDYAEEFINQQVKK